MASLWQNIDAHFIARAWAVLGPAGDYTTHVLPAQPVIEDAWEPDLAAGEYPTMIILSNVAEDAPGGHGDGTVHTESLYRYELIVVEKATSREDARQAAQTLRRRLLALVSDWTNTLDITAGDDGETAQAIQFDRSYVQVRGPNAGEWWALAAVRIGVEAAV